MTQLCRSLAVAAFAGALIGCASQSLGLPAELRGTTWKWTGMTTPVETIAVDAPERYTIAFPEEGRIALRADCNRGSEQYSVGADRRIAFGPIVLTRVACPPGSLSDRYVREVERATSFFIKDGALFLELPVDSGTLRFERVG